MSEESGPFGWWMPGAGTAAKVGVFVAILVILVVCAVATRWVLRRWRKHHTDPEEGGLDDQEILGPNALKELFFAKPNASQDDKEDPLVAFSDGAVWLREDAGRRQHPGPTTPEQSTPLAHGVSPDSATPPPATTTRQPTAKGIHHSSSGVQAEDSMSVASSSAFLLDERQKQARDGDRDHWPEITSAATNSPTVQAVTAPGMQLYLTPSSGMSHCATTSAPGSHNGRSPHAHLTGSGHGLLMPTHSYSSSCGDGGAQQQPQQRPEHLAMVGVAQMLCPGEPVLENRLHAVLQEALHGPGSGNGLHTTTSSRPATGASHSPSMSEHMEDPTMQSRGVPSPAIHAPPRAVSPGASADGGYYGSMGVLGSSPVLTTPPAAPGIRQPQAMHMGAWGMGTLTARDILTGARSPRDLAILMAQQMPPMGAIELQQRTAGGAQWQPAVAEHGPGSHSQSGAGTTHGSGCPRVPRAQRSPSRLRHTDHQDSSGSSASAAAAAAAQAVCVSDPEAPPAAAKQDVSTAPAQPSPRDPACLAVAASMDTLVQPPATPGTPELTPALRLNTPVPTMQPTQLGYAGSQPSTPTAQPGSAGSRSVDSPFHPASQLPAVSRLEADNGQLAAASFLTPAAHAPARAVAEGSDRVNTRSSVSQIMGRQSSGGLSSVDSRGYDYVHSGGSYEGRLASVHEYASELIAASSNGSRLATPSPLGSRLGSASMAAADTGFPAGGGVFGNPLYGSMSARSTPCGTSTVSPVGESSLSPPQRTVSDDQAEEEEDGVL